MTDQKILARRVERPLTQAGRVRTSLSNPFPVFSALILITLERPLDPEGPDDIRPKPGIAVQRGQDSGVDEEGTERVPLRAKGKIDRVIPDIVPIGLPTPEHVEPDGQVRVEPGIEARNISQVALLGLGRPLVAEIQMWCELVETLGGHEKPQNGRLSRPQEIILVPGGELHLADNSKIWPGWLFAQEVVFGSEEDITDAGGIPVDYGPGFIRS